MGGRERAEYGLLACPDLLVMATAQAVNSDIERTIESGTQTTSVNLATLKLDGGRTETVAAAKVSFSTLASLLPPEMATSSLSHDRRDTAGGKTGQIRCDGQRHFADAIFGGEGPAIVPIYAGLGNSWRILNDLGLSRGSSCVTFESLFDIGQLSRGEA